jgi:hypothetical protein
MPILLIAIGALFLLRNWNPGFEPFQILRMHWRLILAVVLILVGLGKIWDSSRNRVAGAGGTSSGLALGTTLGAVACVFVLIIVIGHFEKKRYHDEPGDTFERHSSQVVETRDLKGAESVDVDLHMGSGQLNVQGGSAHLLNADFRYDRKWDNPTVDYHVSGDKGVLEVRQPGESVDVGPTENTWDLNFNNDVPMDFHVELGAVQGNLRLGEMNVRSLEVQAGVAQVTVDLTGARKSDMKVDVKGGIGQITVRLPRDVGVKAHAAGGIGTVQAHGLKESGSEYTNDVYGKTPHKITMDIQGGIGEIELIEE